MNSARPSPAQNAARGRNWQIFKLRGLHARVSMLTGERRAAAQAAVDQELALLDAEPEGERAARLRRELYERLAEGGSQ